MSFIYVSEGNSWHRFCSACAWPGWRRCSLQLLHFLTFPQFPRCHQELCPLRQTTCAFELATLQHPAMWEMLEQYVKTREVVRLKANLTAFSKWKRYGLPLAFLWESEMITLLEYWTRSPRSMLTRRRHFQVQDWKRRTMWVRGSRDLSQVSCLVVRLPGST